MDLEVGRSWKQDLTVVVDKNMKNEKYGTHLHRLFDKPEDTPYLQNRKHRTKEA
jgi:hypothetical protein